MKAHTHFFLLALSWSLAAAKDEKNNDSALNSTDSEKDGSKDKGARDDQAVEMPFGFLTVQQSYVATSNASGDGEGVASVAQLSFHAKLMEALAKAQVEKFGVNWTLADFCYKQHLHKPNNKRAETLFMMIERALPCTVVSPLDCFMEGGFIHGPYPPMSFGKRISEFGFAVPKELDWTSHDPEDFWVALKVIAGRAGNFKLKTKIQAFLDNLEVMGIIHGYSDKFCLDPQNPRCPVTSPSKYNATAVIEVGSTLGSGCKGVIESVMDWNPEMFLDGFAQVGPGEPVVSAESLETTILLANASRIFTKFSLHPGIKPGFDLPMWTNEGVTGAASLVSEWVNMTLGILKKFAQTNGFDPTVIDFSPNQEWIEASNVHEKLMQAGNDGVAGWESMFGDYDDFIWLFTIE